MMKRTAPDFQAEDRTARELDLEQRLRAGDHQVVDDLLALLQPYLLRRASQHISEYRHLLPTYVEALDLVQEASLVIWKRREEARTKESPLTYLIATGYQVMRCLCFSLMKEPHTCSLDQPCFPDDETPLCEYLPTSLLPPSPYASEDEEKYTPLYEAIEQLSESQRTILLRVYGLQEHAPETPGELQHDLGWSRARVSHQETKGRAALVLALKEKYPDYVGETPPTGYQLSEAQRFRLDQAYARLQGQGRSISVRALRKEAKTCAEAAYAFLWEREGSPRLPFSQIVRQRCRERLDQAYASWQNEKRKLNAHTLSQKAGVTWNAAHAYLKQKQQDSLVEPHTETEYV